MFLGRDSPLESHSYLLLGIKTILVDAGMPDELIFNSIKSLHLSPKNLDLILSTHCHFDHIWGNKSLKEKTSAKLAAGKDDAPHIESADDYTCGSMFKENVQAADVDVLLKGGEKLNDFEVLSTPGHTAGSVCLFRKSDGILISGDTIFAEGYPGRTDLPSGSQEEMIKTLKRMEKLSIEKIFPAHGVPVLKNAQENIRKALNYLMP